MMRLLPTWIAATTLAMCGTALGASERSANHDIPGITREFVTTHRHAILDEFIQLLKIPNIASDRTDIRRNADAIMAMLQRRGLQPQLLTASSDPTIPPIVFGQWSVPKARRTIVLYAHYDGQPVNPAEWVTAPFTPTLRSAPIEKGGSVISAAESDAAVDPKTRLYARGSGDDKLGVMVILAAIDALRATHQTPTDNIKLVFEGEEEAGSPHLAELLMEHQALLGSQLWVVCDGPVHPTGRKLVVYGARGDENIDVTVYGPVRALHSGHYGNWAPNPALRLAQLLASMKDEKGHILVPGWSDDVAPLGELERRAIKAAAGYDDAIRRELGLAATEDNGPLAAATTLPSLNINGMRSANIGAQAANVIPDSATAVLDVRLVLGNDPERQYGKLRDFIRNKGYYVIDRPPSLDERLEHPLIANVKLRPGVYPAARAPMDDPLAHAIADAVRSSSDQEVIELPTSGGSLPLAIIEKALGTRSISVPTANYDDNQHAANENLRLGNLWEGIVTYATMLTHHAPGPAGQRPVASSQGRGSPLSARRSEPLVAESDGTVHVPGFDLPLSVYMSTQARASLIKQLRGPPFDLGAVTPDKVAALRKSVNASVLPALKHMQERYPVEIGERVLAGVRAHTVLPRNAAQGHAQKRVLINLHGGGFLIGDSGSIGLLESIPIASLGGIQVISIDYRQGPEFQFPAASEDVAAVYRELLEQFAPQNIGIYGCSAGGLLAAEAAAWIQTLHLPRPGAIGVLCASADARWAGDTYFTVPALFGRAPPSPGAPPNYDEKYYYGTNDLANPLMSPVASPAILAYFPPTLILTGTRAEELSAAAHTETELIKAGATAELHVWDGMGHAFFMDPDLPESQEAYRVIVKFFERHLGNDSYGSVSQDIARSNSAQEPARPAPANAF